MPISHWLRSQVPCGPQIAAVSEMPNSSGKDRLAPLLPVWSQPWVAAPIEQMMMVA